MLQTTSSCDVQLTPFEAFLSTSYVRNAADKYGRRPLLYILPLLAMVATTSMIIAYITTNPILPWVLLALNGIFISASTKSLFVPGLSVSDVADDQQRTRFFSRLEAVSLLGPGTGYVLSGLISRYTNIVLLPYYLALGFQFLAAVYAFLVIPETLPDLPDNKSVTTIGESEDRNEGLIAEAVEVVEDVMDAVVQPVKPLALLLPHRNRETGKFEWRLTLVTISLLLNTIGVSQPLLQSLIAAR